MIESNGIMNRMESLNGLNGIIEWNDYGIYRMNGIIIEWNRIIELNYDGMNGIE